MKQIVKCPACGAVDFDLAHYESMMVLRTDCALFTLRCPHCGTAVSSVCPIPASLREDVENAAIAVDAGMGKSASGK